MLTGELCLSASPKTLKSSALTRSLGLPSSLPLSARFTFLFLLGSPSFFDALDPFSSAHGQGKMNIPTHDKPSYQQSTKTIAQTGAQKKLDEARTKLKLEHTEAARAVVDPSAEKPPRLTARQRAKYAKLTATDDILAAAAANRWASLTSSDQYLMQPDRPSEEPFYAQLEEIRRIHDQFSLLARCSHAQVDSQARR